MSAEAEKRRVLDVLESEWQRLDTQLRSLDDADLDHRVLGEGEGWRVRDMITHMAWWQELAARVAEKITTEGGVPDDRGSRPFLGIETPLDELNATTYETWRERPLADRLERWLEAHRRMMVAFRALSPDQLLQADGPDGLKRYFAMPGVVHLRMHREHIEAALKESPTT